MREPRIRTCLVALLLAVSPLNSFGQSGPTDECSRTARMEIYSDAQVSKETGDLGGFELALGKPHGSQREALLFVYEGAESEGIPLTATAESDNLVIEGIWIEHLTEYPSKKETVQTHQVRIVGKLTPKIFRGRISIGDFEIVNPENMRLKKVKRIWSCKTRSPQ